MIEQKPHNSTHVRIYSPTGMIAAYDTEIDADTLARRIFDLIADLRKDTEPCIRSDGWYSTTHYMGATDHSDTE